MVRTIPLTKGKIAIVDDEDYDRLIKYKWSAMKCSGHWYAVRVETELMHRNIMNVKDSKNLCDHANNNTLDNRKMNLRICNDSQNMANRLKGTYRGKPASSKYKGVSWIKTMKKWRSGIKKDYKLTVLGHFDTEIDAAKCYDDAARRLFGEYARTNF